MFTGIIECLGRVVSVEDVKGRGVSRIKIAAPGLTKGLAIGKSVAVNGVCLTAVKKNDTALSFDVMTETKRRSSLGSLEAGDRVNLERTLKATDRIEGHFVLGHVDALGSVEKIVHGKKEASFLIRFPKLLLPYILEKGSVAVDGVSLTIGKIVQRRAFWVHCIPHTLKLTTFGRLKEGDGVNLEGDILIKYFRSQPGKLTDRKSQWKKLRAVDIPRLAR